MESTRDPDELDPADGLALLAADSLIEDWAADKCKTHFLVS